MARKLKEADQRLGSMTNYKVRVVEKLTNWREAEILDDIQEETVPMKQTLNITNTKVKDAWEIKDGIIMETERVEKDTKLRKKKEEISKEVQKKKFKFRNRGKITKAEQRALIRTPKGGALTGSRSQR